MLYILALQTDSGRLYWGGMREMRNDQGYRWQENPHQACCFDLKRADEYRREIGHGSALIVEVEAEFEGWRNASARREVLVKALELDGARVAVTYAIAEALPADIVNRIEARFVIKES